MMVARVGLYQQSVSDCDYLGRDEWPLFESQVENEPFANSRTIDTISHMIVCVHKTIHISIFASLNLNGQAQKIFEETCPKTKGSASRFEQSLAFHHPS